MSSPAREWLLAMEREGDRRPSKRRLELLRTAAKAHVEYARAAAEVGHYVLGRLYRVSVFAVLEGVLRFVPSFKIFFHCIIK